VPEDAPTPYDLMGGEPVVRTLVDRFYDIMDADPALHTLRAMHAKSLSSSREKLFAFLSGWLGGPPLYVQRWGHPALRRRHLPFAIDDDAAMQWMSAMNRALAETVPDQPLRDGLSRQLTRVAAHMRNQ